MGSFTLKCPFCGGSTIMNPETGRVECTQCGKPTRAVDWGTQTEAMVKTDDGKLMDKRSFKELKKAARIKRYITDTKDSIYTLDEINRGQELDSPGYMEMNLYECTSCGAKLMVKATETSSFCAYCGQPMTFVDRMEKEQEPDLIIPFSISQKRAEQLVRERFCKGWFVPDEIKNFEIEKLRGIYIPHWLVSYHVRKKIRYTYQIGEMEESLTTHEKLFRADYSYKSAKLDKPITHNCMRDFECVVSQVPGDATRKLNDNISRRLEPYDLKKAQEFAPEYLSGFYTDRYDVPAEEIAAEAKRRSNQAVKMKMLDEVYQENVKITDEQTDIKIMDVEYALLPAWFMTFRYKGILYTVAVNGQTGKVVGNVPSNRFKVGAAIGLLMTVMTCLCTFVSVFFGNIIYAQGVIDYSTLCFFAGMVIAVGLCFWRGINKLHQSRIDIHRFRSYGTIEYIKERQDKTWVR